MYGSVVKWQLKPGTGEQVLRAMREVFLPALQQQTGFRHVSLLQTGDSLLTYADLGHRLRLEGCGGPRVRPDGEPGPRAHRLAHRRHATQHG